nr:hypothetical protein [Akkermansiaceae bacterium]
DPDSFIRGRGVEEFRALLAQAAEFFEFKLRRARGAGRLESAAERQALTAECVDLLAAMSDAEARDYQIRVVATLLQITEAALRNAVAETLKKPKPAYAEDIPSAAETPAGAVSPTPLHRMVGFLCHLALTSGSAQHFLAEQYECIHEAGPWLEGVPLLERILAAAPDPASSAAVNAFLTTLQEADRLALAAIETSEPDRRSPSDGDTNEEATPGGTATASDTPSDDSHDPSQDALNAAEHALASLSGIVLHRRDARVKADLKQPGLSPQRIAELMEEAKQIAALLRGIGQRYEFDDDLPPSTFREKPKPKWRKRDGG